MYYVLRAQASKQASNISHGGKHDVRQQVNSALKFHNSETAFDRNSRLPPFKLIFAISTITSPFKDDGTN